jgi:microsomal dipeptidase-like Zn-dependent dipeptidase
VQGGSHLRRGVVGGAVATALVAAAAAGLAAGHTTARASIPSRYALAGRCLALSSGPAAPRFYFKATGLGTYMLYDPNGRVLIEKRVGVSRVPYPGAVYDWAAQPLGGGTFALRSTVTHKLLSLAPRGGAFTVSRASGRGTAFRLEPATGCKPFPEAQVDASGTPSKGTNRRGKVFGFVDDHLHITANLRGGGLVISGEPFDRFGIAVALGQDEKVHGPNGSLDVTGNLLRTGSPTGTHDTHGWPTFKGWPTFDTQTHQQTYYVWLQRAWDAGERLVVAQTVDDQPMCRIEPRKVNKSCSETASIEAQIRTLRRIQDYVDAQSGGPGRGWFRLVYSPAQARSVIAAGKLAVVIGIESSDLFGCSEREGKPQCTRSDIVKGIRNYQRLGVRGMFIAHWVNNAFAGAALEDGAKGVFINLLNRFQTGSYFTVGACPGQDQGVSVVSLPQSLLESLSKFFPATKSIAKQGMPPYPAGPQCNMRGLTSLGRFMIEQMIKAHMLIEVDHLSQSARDAVLSIAAKAHYPLVSSHNGTGGEWSTAELTELYKLGGFAAVTPDQAPALAQKILSMTKFKDRSRFFGVGIGTDTGGFSSLPGPRSDAMTHPLRYPFKSYDGNMTFTREVTGSRTFDLNTDGVAQYGLIADLLADMRQQPGGRQALALLFGSAEAYLETWQRAIAHR